MPRPERPLDPNAGAVARFAAELRALRQGAGNPSYRELAKLAHYSPTALSEAAGGERLGSLPVTMAYVRACGGDPQWWEARWRAAVAEVGRRPHAGGAQPRPCPYGHPVMLAGRDRLVAAVLDRIAAGVPVAVSGASGAGTTSVLCSGILPALGRDGTAGWPVVFLEPGDDPLEELSVHLAALLGLTAGAVHAELTGDGRALHRFLRQALVNHPPGTCAVLVVDQFEQLVTRCRDSAKRVAFLDALEAVCQADTCRVRLVLGVREDVLWHKDFAAHPGVASVLGNSLAVGGLDRESLRRAIIGPAAGAGVTVEGALTGVLVADAHGRPGGLSLLSLTLRELWPHREGYRLTYAAYQAVDGVRGVLSRIAERAYGRLSPPRRAMARRALLRLSALNAGVWLDRDELEGADAALESLAAQRILVIGGGGVALAHEALPVAWPRLRGWLEANADCLRIHRGLADAARDWRRLGREPEALLQGPSLGSTLDWAAAARDSGDLNALEVEFLEASRAAAPRTARTRLRLVAVALTVALLAAGATSGSAPPTHAAQQSAVPMTAIPMTAVPVAVETQVQPGLGDFDGLVIWRNLDDPGRSRVLASGSTGLTVFSLAGGVVQHLGGRLDHIDVRDGIVAATDSAAAVVHLYRIDAGLGTLVELTTVPISFEGRGVCLYHSPATGKLFLFVISDRPSGEGPWVVEQQEIAPAGTGVVPLSAHRFLRVPGKSGHCVADDPHGHLYVTEDTSAIWRFDAEPQAGPVGRKVATIDRAVLVRGVAGLAIAGPYLLATSAGDHTMVAFDIDGYHPVRKFWLAGQDRFGASDDTGALAALPGAAGPGFPSGILVCHDRSNDGSGRSIKYADLGLILHP